MDDFRVLALVFFLPTLAGALSSESLATCSGTMPMKERPAAISIADFGGVGDGVTVNTRAFQEAVYTIKRNNTRAGTMLYIPPGVWLTGSFNLTSHMTLFLANGAIIRAVQDTENWPLVRPLPSYGRGRERPGGRYMSLIHGDNIHDVIITGENGTIDGKGDVWWNMWRQRTLGFTRPNLVELMHSRDIIISNITFQNSPFWNIHPVYCSNVLIQYITVLAPRNSPNTDGVDPDSCNNVCIEDCYMSTGDDMVAVKSGWDEYGIAFNRPSNGIIVRRLTGSSPFAGIAVGSEMSGGVENVLVENITLSDMGVGINIKTNRGRGGYIKNVTISGVTINGGRKGVNIAGDVGDHPDDKFDPDAVPVVDGIRIRNVSGTNVQQPGSLLGIKGAPPYVGICLSNIKLYGGGEREVQWKCADVQGGMMDVQPGPCSELTGADTMRACFGSL